MNKIYIYYLVLTVLLTLSCEPNINIEGYEPQIVVEGFIENGEYPVVSLSQMIPIEENGVTDIPIKDIPIRWAKVTIDNGTEKEIMVGRRDTRYLTQYIYTTLDMRGEIGRTYTLTVEYSGRTLTAKTTIPPPVPIHRIEVVKTQCDTLCQLYAFVNDPQTEQNYYMFKNRKRFEDVFRISLLGVWNDRSMTLQTRIPLYGTLHPVKEPEPSLMFPVKNGVWIRLAHIEQAEYDFWKGFMDQLLNTTNPIYPVNKSLESNIKGGLGIWYGCGISTIWVNIPDSLAQNKQKSTY